MEIFSHTFLFHFFEIIILLFLISGVSFIFIKRIISNFTRNNFINIFNVYTSLVKISKLSKCDYINIYKYNYSNNKNFITTKLLLTLDKNCELEYSTNTCELPATANNSTIKILNSTENELIEIYNNFNENNNIAYAKHKIINEANNNPIDYTFIDVNKQFEDLTGLKNVVNKKLTQVIPEINKDIFNCIEFYGEISKSQKTKKIIQNSKSLNRKYIVHVFSDEVGYFTTLFTIVDSGNSESVKFIETYQNYYKFYVQNIFKNGIPIGYITISFHKEHKIPELKQREIIKLINNIRSIIS